MKYLCTLLFMTIFIVSYCGEKIVKYKSLINKDKILYKKGDTKPFSGTCTDKKDEFEVVNGLITKGRIYFKNGQIKSKEYFKNGKQEGEAITFYENGKIYSKDYFKNGKQDGEYIKLHISGKIKEKGFYENGQMKGAMYAWHKNGQKKCEGNYKNGKLDGVSYFWYNNGVFKSKCIWKSGNLLYCKDWDENGNVKSEQRFNFKK